MRRIAIPVIAALAGLIALGGPAPGARAETSQAELAPRGAPFRWSLFGSVAGGLGSVHGSEYSSAPLGPSFLLGGLVSYLATPEWVVDAGLSWLYSDLGGQATPSLNVDVVTRAAMLELSPRYRLDDHWQLGPVLGLAFGTDTGFAPRVQGSSANAMLGARGVYETRWGSLPARYLGQLSTDLTMVGIQVGFPLGGSGGSGSDGGAPVSSSSASAARKKRPVTPEVRVSLNPRVIFFGTGSPRIRPEVKDALREIGDYLEHDTGNWESAEISGHADQRGKYDYNLKLSGQRAEAVKRELIVGGATRARLKTTAHSYLHPLDKRNNQEAWAKNRRVELVFRNVSEPEPLLEKLKPLVRLSEQGDERALARAKARAAKRRRASTATTQKRRG